MPGDPDDLGEVMADATVTVDVRDHVEWLVDNADAYRALIGMIRGARADLWISQLALDTDCIAYDVEGRDTPEQDADVTLASELCEAARRGVRVRVLLNASMLLDTVAPLRKWLAASEVRGEQFRVRGISRFPQLLHAKMLIADGIEAVLVGSPFANGYWDDTCHAPTDDRRPMRELGGRPVHDLSVQLMGRAVDRLRATFAELWNNSDDIMPGDDDHLRAPTHLPQSDDERPPIRVVRTAPYHSTPRHHEGRMEILPALLDGILRARSFIYIEHQYLSARPIIAALTTALANEPELEIIIVLNQNPDVTAYRGWQNARLLEAGLLDHPRVGVFALWSAARNSTTGKLLLNQIFVHSKLVLIDDVWATIGSANLDGVSLHSYGDDFTGMLGRRLFRNVRNFDVNVVIDAAAADETIALSLVDLRCRLWCEHLGTHIAPATERPSDGWLQLWHAQSRGNICALGCRTPELGPATLVTPYSARLAPHDQIAALGMELAKDNIEVCFDPSWLELHFSPNWFRNMFA